MPSPATPASLADRFALILGGLHGAVAARMSRPWTPQQRTAFPALMLLCSYLRRVVARFARLAARASPPHPTRPAAPRIPPQIPRTRLPQGLGWVVRLLPGEAACFASQLQHLLAEPDVAALLQAAPQAARLLRPLCRMLAIPGPAAAEPAPCSSGGAPNPDPDSAPAPAPAGRRVPPLLDLLARA